MIVSLIFSARNDLHVGSRRVNVGALWGLQVFSILDLSARDDQTFGIWDARVGYYSRTSARCSTHAAETAMPFEGIRVLDVRSKPCETSQVCLGEHWRRCAGKGCGQDKVGAMA